MNDTIVMDVSRLVGRVYDGMLPTGIDRIMIAYMQHYRASMRALITYGGRWIVFGPKLTNWLFDTVLSPPKHRRWKIRAVVAFGWLFAWRRKPALLMNIGHYGLEKPGYGRYLRKHGWSSLFYLHDLIPITHGEYFPPGATAMHAMRIGNMLKIADAMVHNSADTQRKLEWYAQQHGLPVTASVIGYPAPTPLPASDTTAPMAEPYFLVLGTIEPRKNHLLLLHVWREIAESMGQAAPRLVTVGQRGWECEQVQDLLERCTSLRDLVIEQSRCSDADLARWMRHARALLFPSFTEGFGIPLVEALSHGVPAIVSDIAVFREIAGDIPEYLSPLDGLGWQRTILDYALPESPLRQAQMARLRGYRAPGWAEHFAKIDRFLLETRLFCTAKT